MGMERKKTLQFYNFGGKESSHFGGDGKRFHFLFSLEKNCWNFQKPERSE